MSIARRSRLRSRGFTLIELLVSMTITLIMVYSLVQFMVYISTYVSEGRGQIEMAGSLRGVRAQLYKDLQMATVFLKPSPSNDNSPGGIALSEGNRSDCDADGDLLIDVNQAGDRDLNGTPDQQEGKGPTRGDTDDVIWLTARSSGEPYVGQYRNMPAPGAPTALTSDLAEIIWFTSHFQFDATGAATATFTDPFRPECTLYRRALLIRPDLNGRNPDPSSMAGPLFDNDTQTYYLYNPNPAGSVFTGMTAQTDAYNALLDYWQTNDISAAIVAKTYVNMMGTQIKYLLVANSLSDLSRRENRFGNSYVFPGQLLLAPDNAVTLTPYILKGARIGQDIMLSHVTAFDLRVYDAGAVVRTDGNNPANSVLTPGDPGYFVATTVDVGTGAFVDMGYRREVYDTPMPRGVAASSFFWEVRPVVNVPALSGSPPYTFNLSTTLLQTYDSWSFSYEHDGINQDGDYIDANMNSMRDAGEDITDEGTDGLDSTVSFGLDVANSNGVDDPSERETFPPYPVVLSGLQIRIRIYDHSIRLGRQATVVTEFNR